MRFKTIKNILEKEFDVLPLKGIYGEVFGQAEANGLWLIYGAEKHGKTTFSLLLANELAKYKKTAYIMAEQGFDKDFQDALSRLHISATAELLFQEYIPIEQLSKQLKKRKQPDILFIDNITIYNDELKNGMLRKLALAHPSKLFVFIAHEDKGEPYTATAKLARRLAKRIVRVEGMQASVEGRSKGGQLLIDENTASIYWGTDTPDIESSVAEPSVIEPVEIPNRPTAKQNLQLIKQTS
ncbi:MAG: hypothetical protein LC105_06000 [Chitinophagales bacterium]|nr:hypothetical protein [Chitinophagales bacterium]